VKIVSSPVELNAALERSALVELTGLVPTMGSLHEGHLSLIRMARSECSRVVVSIFVNPTQFSETRDLDAYPRQLERDAELAANAGAGVVFAPNAEDMYPDGFETWVEPSETAKGLEGQMRPGHFRGVATVCLKLFNLVAPHHAYFGWKDAQQTAVVARMISDLNVQVTLRLGETVREPDGLALSSRNARLSADERDRAKVLPRALHAGLAAHAAHQNAKEAALAVLADDPQLEVEYVEEMTAHGHRLLCAALRIGTTRLIDNMRLEESA
jgi:pantoate--beta-alanine ligase